MLFKSVNHLIDKYQLEIDEVTDNDEIHFILIEVFEGILKQNAMLENRIEELEQFIGL